MPNTNPTFKRPPMQPLSFGALAGMVYAIPVALLLWAVIALCAVVLF